MLLVSHKVVLIENKAVLCVTMHERGIWTFAPTI